MLVPEPSARTFSTKDAPATERVGLYRQAMSATFATEFAVKAVEVRPLDVELVYYRGRRLQLSKMRFSPHSASSGGAPEKRSRLSVNLQKAGESVFAQGGREWRLGPGDMFLIDPARPFHFETGEVCAHSLEFPAHALRALVPRVDDLTAVPFKAYEGTPALFRAMFDELFALAPTLTDDVADRAADALPHVLAAAIDTVEHARDVSPSALKLLHKQRIRSFALDHLGDPGLDVPAIAEGVRLSPRYVHRLFADEPATLMKWIWAERLERCRCELATPSLRARSVGEIAYGWGFNDLAHFSRSFRERFGQSPRSLRASLR